MNTSTLVSRWFGDTFRQLAPELQALHLHGGMLSGLVNVTCSEHGLGKILGQRLAKKLGVPTPGQHPFRVEISHSEHHLHWDRVFDHDQRMNSTFTPIGTVNNGYWVESTGPITIRLTVNIIEGGWHWQVLRVSAFGIPLPLWLFPKSNAYKTIENGRYRFEVSFSLPLVGKVLGYGGVLKLNAQR